MGHAWGHEKERGAGVCPAVVRQGKVVGSGGFGGGGVGGELGWGGGKNKLSDDNQGTFHWFTEVL